jgi:WD40 repeat protein
VHDFGVNSLDATIDRTTAKVIIASGGDDQKIAVLIVGKDRDG